MDFREILNDYNENVYKQCKIRIKELYIGEKVVLLLVILDSISFGFLAHLMSTGSIPSRPLVMFSPIGILVTTMLFDKYLHKEIREKRVQKRARERREKLIELLAKRNCVEKREKLISWCCVKRENCGGWDKMIGPLQGFISVCVIPTTIAVFSVLISKEGIQTEEILLMALIYIAVCSYFFILYMMMKPMGVELFDREIKLIMTMEDDLRALDFWVSDKENEVAVYQIVMQVGDICT